MKLPAPYTLRPALPEELPLLNGIELDSARRLPVEILPEPLRSRAVPVKELQEALSADMLWIIADGANIPIGYCVLQYSHGIALLEQIDVSEGHGKKGLGRALMQRAAARATELGSEWLYLTTFTNIPWNAPFYASMGFIPLPDADLPPMMREILMEERKYLSHRIAMRKPLGPPEVFLTLPPRRS